MSWFEKLMPSRIRTENKDKRTVPEGLWSKCPACDAVLYRAELERNQDVCPKCDQHMRIGARRRLDLFLARNAAEPPPDCQASDTRMLLGDLKAAIESEIKTHFAFEEEALFPLLAEAGADDVNGILHEEHEILLPLGDEIVALADAASREGFTQAGWAKFRKVSRDFVDGLREHVDKEEMSLVPLVEDILSDDMDDDLIRDYKFS